MTREEAIMKLKNNPYSIISMDNMFKEDKELILIAIQNGFEEFGEFLGRRIALEILLDNGENLRNDKDFIIELLKKDVQLIEWANDDIKTDVNFLFSVLEDNEIGSDITQKMRYLRKYFFMINDKIIHESEVAKRLVKYDPELINLFDEDIRNSSEFEEYRGIQLNYRDPEYEEATVTVESPINISKYGIVVSFDEENHRAYSYIYKDKDTLYPFDVYSSTEYVDGVNYPKDYCCPNFLVCSPDLSKEENYELFKRFKYMHWQKFNCEFDYKDFLNRAYKDELIDCLGLRNYSTEQLLSEGKNELSNIEFEEQVDRRVLLNRALYDLEYNFRKNAYNEKGQWIGSTEMEVEFETEKERLIEEFETEKYEVLLSKYSEGWKKEKTQDELIEEITAQFEKEAELERQIAVKEGRVNVKG